MKRLLLIIGGIGLFLFGAVLSYNATQNLPSDLSTMQAQEKLRSSDLPIGTGICGVGALCFITGIVWNKIPSRYKP